MLWQCTGFEGSNFIEIYALYTGISISYLHSGLQGPPLGIDIMYLVLADRSMQVRFGLKVVWGS